MNYYYAVSTNLCMNYCYTVSVKLHMNYCYTVGVKLRMPYLSARSLRLTLLALLLDKLYRFFSVILYADVAAVHGSGQRSIPTVWSTTRILDSSCGNNRFHSFLGHLNYGIPTALIRYVQNPCTNTMIKRFQVIHCYQWKWLHTLKELVTIKMHLH